MSYAIGKLLNLPFQWCWIYTHPNKTKGLIRYSLTSLIYPSIQLYIKYCMKSKPLTLILFCRYLRWTRQPSRWPLYKLYLTCYICLVLTRLMWTRLLRVQRMRPVGRRVRTDLGIFHLSMFIYHHSSVSYKRLIENILFYANVSWFLFSGSTYSENYLAYNLVEENAW